MHTRKAYETREAPLGAVSDDQPDACEGQAGRRGVAERFVVPVKPGNAGGGKGPQFKTDAELSEGHGDWATYQLRTAFRNCRRRAREDGVKSCPRAGCGKSARPVVCPAKAGMFSRRKACRGKSQKPRSLDSRVEGNRDSEAYRQRLPREDDESPGRNDSERKCGLESA